MPVGDKKPGWSVVVDGLNEASKKVYFTIFDRFKEQGFFECLSNQAISKADLGERFKVPSAVRHRFEVALQGLRAIGVLEIVGERVRLLQSNRAHDEIRDEQIDSAFGPAFWEYLKIYKEDRLLDPGFSLTFEGEQAPLWEGLLNAPINTVGGDQAVEWISRPGARVLELAFGPGGTIRQLSEKVGDKGEIYGVDISHYYVKRAEDEFRDRPNVVRLIEADINEGLSYLEDDAFDGAMFMGALQFVKDPPALFRELERITRTRGKLVLGAFHTTKPCFSNPALHLHMNLFSPPALEYSVDRVKDWLWQVGFETNITVEFGSYCSLYAEKMPEVWAE
jgi:ubiquinone/menaquinone biosynthesis C-methylase UbiE